MPRQPSLSGRVEGPDRRHRPGKRPPQIPARWFRDRRGPGGHDQQPDHCHHCRCGHDSGRPGRACRCRRGGRTRGSHGVSTPVGLG
ncbi:hypothetical protein GJR88_02896 [Dietzia sp. DQ12-45-1b]|nr:hypothetical protein GJR88_02896 [Dietzia sp. DQ12-45-1b]